jgi:mono/diheme cytochrome c family protein
MNGHAAWLPIVTVNVLTGCSAPTSGPASAASEGQSEPDRGARIYSGNCIACHQQDARGIPGVYPSLVGSPVLLGDPKELTLWVVNGRRPASMPTGRYPTRMVQFGWMKEQDAAALFTYLRSHFGNTAPPVDAATVTQALYVLSNP